MPIGYTCRGCKMAPVAKLFVGPCPNCGGFFNIVPKSIEELEGAENASAAARGEVVSLADAMATVQILPRLETGFPGFDDVIGGGIPPGSLLLLAGDPGSGKTTLLLQALREAAIRRIDSLYVSGEQPVNEMAARFKELDLKVPQRLLMLAETDIDAILDAVDEHQPKIVVIDSIQTIVVDEELEVGSAASIKAVIRAVMEYAKDEGVAFIIIGHVTKGGVLSGPKALEHFVDASLYLAKEGHIRRRFQCEGKSRIGATHKVAYYDLTEKGHIPVDIEAERVAAEEAAKPPATRELDGGLTSIPLEGAPVKKTNPVKKWRSADGVSVDVVLAVDCDVEDCKGKGGRACNALSGAKEAGFHQSRITKSKLQIVKSDKAPKTPKPAEPPPIDKPAKKPPAKKPAAKKPSPKKKK